MAERTDGYESHHDDHDPGNEALGGVAADDDVPVTDETPDSTVAETAARGPATADAGEVDEIERDRAERLDPDRRPETAEVDNTQRDFDVEKGMFTDADGYDRAPAPFPPPGTGEV